ncbi:MAG: SusC/RagA family TonB-linked outer membrane protein [Balneolales bacterium]
MKYKLLLTLCLLFGLYGTGLAQSQTVEGTVSDAEIGDVLPGVNIQVQGTNVGTTTNIDGEYSIEVPGSESVLIFSYVGYTSEEVTVGNRNIVDVELNADFAQLDEMIVIGYGSVQRSDLTGSVERVDADQFQDQSMTQLTDMLTGTVAGFNASQATSASGSADFEIRGPNSLSAGTEPLIVLNGVIFRGSLSDINPFDVESVDILKDASSAAVYGARAASGVVIITTTKGETGRPTVNFNTRFGSVGTTTDHYKWRGAEDFISFRQDFYRSQFLGSESRPSHYWSNPENLPEGVSLEEWRGLNQNPVSDNEEEWLNRMNFFPLEKEMYLAGETFDWGEYIYPRGLQRESNLSISGGTDNAQYYWSAGYVDNDGTTLGDQFAAVRTSLNLDFQVVNWLNAGVSAQYSDRDESSIVASRSQTYGISPFSRLRDDEGNLEWYPHGYQVAPNPAINTLNADRDRRINNLFATMYTEFVLPFDITHRVSFQPRYQTLKDYEFWGTDTRTGGYSVAGGRADRLDRTQFDWMLTNMLKWNREFGIHNFDLTLVHEAEKINSWRSFMQNTTFAPSPALGYSGIQFGNSPTLDSDDQTTTGDAMMARLNYILMGKYLITASIRRDGYSAFGQENPRAIFPAAAFAWQISEEDFYNIDLVNSLKLRLSWGVNGNRDIGAYAALSQLGSNLYYDGTNVLTGIHTSTLSNSGLMWEETESFNIGLDIGILENRIDLNLDYYDMTTSNLLVNRALPILTGFSNVTTNIGELGNKGFEMTLRTSNVTSPSFNWSSALNFSLNRNEIKSLFGETGTYTLQGEEFEGEVPSYENNWFPGRAIDAVWDYDMIGIWQEEEAEEAAEYGMSPGDIKARDFNDDGTYEALEDKAFIGHTQPRFRIGFRNEVDFLRNFSASVFVNAALGHVRPYSSARHSWTTYDRNNIAPIPYWTPENRSNEWPGLSQVHDQYGGGIEVYKDASFVRIQDITLSYSLPDNISQLIQLQNLRVFGSVRNLYSFDNWPSWDPESGFTPMPRIITAGVNLSI